VARISAVIGSFSGGHSPHAAFGSHSKDLMLTSK
jgi:hypothetical protein